MKKIIVCLAIILFMPTVKAASYSASASSTNINVGDSVTIYVSANNAAGRFSVSSSNSGVVAFSDNSSSEWLDNNSTTFKFIAKSTGTATITIVPNDVAGYDDTEINDNKYITINVNAPSSNNNNNSNNNKKQTNNNKEKKDDKSSNNNLKSLEIENYKISPDFSKDKTDYTLTVPNDVNKIKILAYKEDDKASLSGSDGEVEVKEGENKFEVVVTAENGSKKTYTIVVTVDSKPIIVKVDNSEYTIVKKKDELPQLDIEHEDMTLTIEEQEIPAYRIDKIGYVLIGLKDSEGKINLYKFDSFKNDEKEPEYHLFKYLKTSGILFIRMDFPKNKIPSNYKKYTEEINGEKIEVYKLSSSSKYSLIYGLNVETGKENIYRYDSNENTLQIFEREEAKKLEAKVLRREKLIIILGGVIFILIILTTIGFTRRPKIKEEVYEEKNIKNELKETEELTKKDIKRIEKENKKLEKKKKKKQKKGDFDM